MDQDKNFAVYFFGESSKKSAYKEDLQRIEESKNFSPQTQIEDDQLNSARSAKLDLIGFEESNPTLNASFVGDYETVKAGLEQKNFDPNYRCNVNGFTALMLASQEGHQDIVEYLLEKGAKTDERNRGGDTALALACLKNQKEIVRVLIDHGCSVNTVNNSGWTPLSLAARYGDAELFTWLLRAGADSNCPPTSGWQLIHHPFGNVNPEVLDLFKPNLCKNKDEFKNKFPGEVDPILIYNHEDGGAPLIIYSARNGSFEAVQFLVNYGVNVDEADPSGWTALMYTIRYNGGDVRTARLLVENKADVNHREKDGWTPFLLACAYGSVDVVKLLVENGANVRVKNDFGYDGLRLAKHWHKEDVRRYLKTLKAKCIIS
eukprot:TRINITY_DN956_c0_g1_i1.p1 TRINITY_DN956_c0_g1~~TRINITY_DN956_c0_g1_i1.p1  ORF type:complete len:375 (-),score=52.82 TRINITY_DN956_c0_g1_i1:103-1227(-)